MNTTTSSLVAKQDAERLSASVQNSFQGQAARLAWVYRGHCARKRSAAFTPLPRGTVPMALRIFPSAWTQRTVKRPEGRAPAAPGRRLRTSRPYHAYLKQLLGRELLAVVAALCAL